MLETLRIKNVALIQELEIKFGAGLNVLSGETGAGKSIIIDSLGFVLGGRAVRDFIRTGANQAQVDALITVRTEEARNALAELGAEPDDDGAVFLSRQIGTEGKSTCRLNGRTVTSGMLKEISGILVDIHGQHQHQSLLDPERHITLLDRFCGGSLTDIKIKLETIHKEYRDAIRAMSQISQSPDDMASKIELYEYQTHEIEEAGLRPDEEEELTEKKLLLNSSEKLNAAADKILDLLSDGERSALDKITDAQGLMAGVTGFSSELAEMAGVLDSVSADLDDMVRDFRKFAENLPQSAEELDEVEERLDLLYRLKRKYGRSIPEVITFYEKTKEKLDILLNSGEELERLRQLIDAKKKQGLELCAELTRLRKEAAAKIQDEIEDTLKDLGMKNARFEVSVTAKDEFTADGADKAEFMISPNPGEPLKPLAKIASGGEMSRVMLALKSALARFDCIETFIFDEIDSGVSGRAAQMVAEKMAKLGRSHQILCVSHLPQIAAMADDNYLIEKKSSEESTSTGVTSLDRNGIIRELARLTGGASITEATLNAADEMKRLADNVKSKFYYD